MAWVYNKPRRFYPSSYGCSFDAKVIIRGTLHTLTSIKELLCQTGNERCRTRFCSTVFGKWLDFPAYSNDNLLLNYIFQHEVKQEQNNDVCPPIRYKIGNNHFEFGRQEFCLITSFAFGKIPKVDTFNGLQNSPFCDRVFFDKIAAPLKKVKVSEVLEVIRSLEMWSALSDEDSVKVCLLLVSNIVFMGREFKNYIAYNLIELVDDLTAWDTYPWGDYFWRALYRRLVNVISRHNDAVMLKNKKNVSLMKKTKKNHSSKKIETYNVYGFVWSLKIYILEMYRNNKFWWKRDLLVIPRGLAWSKIGKFEKGDYGALFVEWSNPILSMAPMSTELLQPWLIRSMGYFQILLVDEQPKDPITASHQELAAVKKMMNAIERFIKSRNDNLTEDSVAKQSVEKEIESSDGKPDSAISDVFIGEISYENLLQEQLQSRDMCIQSTGNQFVQYPLESPNGKNEALFEDLTQEYATNVHESGDGNRITSQFNYFYEYAGFDFDNTDNDSLSDMLKTGEEEIHLHGLEKVDDLFVQTHVKQNSEDLSRAPYSRRTKVKLPECIDMVYALGDETSYIFPLGNNDIVVYRSFWLNLLGLNEGGWLSDKHLDAWFELMWNFRPTDADWAIAISYFCGFVMRGDIPGWVCNGIRTGVITLYDWLFSEAVETRKWWIKMRKAFKIYIPTYLQEWGILDAKGIPLESYNIKFVVGKDVPKQGDAYGDFGV
ncbi:phospholipase-like protein [Tanacetum coccineum]